MASTTILFQQNSTGKIFKIFLLIKQQNPCKRGWIYLFPVLLLWCLQLEAVTFCFFFLPLLSFPTRDLWRKLTGFLDYENLADWKHSLLKLGERDEWVSDHIRNTSDPASVQDNLPINTCVLVEKYSDHLKWMESFFFLLIVAKKKQNKTKFLYMCAIVRTGCVAIKGNYHAEKSSFDPDTQSASVEGSMWVVGDCTRKKWALEGSGMILSARDHTCKWCLRTFLHLCTWALQKKLCWRKFKTSARTHAHLAHLHASHTTPAN